MPVAVKQHLHASLAVSGRHRQHVHIGLARHHMLLLGGLAQLNQLVTQQRRLLVSTVFRRRFHLGGEFLQQRIALAV